MNMTGFKIVAMALLLSAQSAVALPKLSPATAGNTSLLTQASLRPTLSAIEPTNSITMKMAELKLLDVPASPKGLIPSPKIVAKIDLSDQRMRVFVDGEEQHSWKVSTARRGYYTPRGSYTPYRMHKMWYSRKYNNSPMPYAVFFHKGWAVHGTNAIRRLGRPASHGCVRLHPKNAKAFYRMIKQAGGMKSAKVEITN